MSARLTIVVLACLISASALALADNAKRVDVPAGNLIEGLESLARQCGVDVIYPSGELKGLTTRGVSGTLEPKEAFRKLIEGTPLILKEQGSAVLISLPSASTRALSGNPSDTAGSDAQSQEGKKSSSGGFRVAQVDQGKTSSPPTVEKEEASKKQPVDLEEVIVTGSRIPLTAKEGAQDVKIYARERIEQSGRATVAGFLNNLPDVSVSSNEHGAQLGSFGTTVQLHGLPVGTTLVMLNGRRLEASGASGIVQLNFFDLENIPLAAVQRIEVVSVGSSAVYGSDAIAGVVNIIVNKDFDGLEFNTKYARADETGETNASFAWGKRWDGGHFSVIGSYQTRSVLLGFDRAITANEDYRKFGGIDGRSFYCSPGNVYSMNGANLPGTNAPYAAVPPGFTGAPTRQEFAATAGTLNACSPLAYFDILPATRRFGTLASANYSLTPAVELFSEILYSKVRQLGSYFPPYLFGQPGYQSFTVSASNPYNPFGVNVGISNLLTNLPSDQPLDTVFVRSLLGANGKFLKSWKWELAAWDSEDRSTHRFPDINNSLMQNALNSTDPATALNPFVDGPLGSTALLQPLFVDHLQRFRGQVSAVNGFVRGPVFELPSGPVELAFGGEYDRGKLFFDQYNNDPNLYKENKGDFYRNSRAVFSEARIPLLANRTDPSAGDRLALSLAARYDNYSDFGHKTTPQLGAEWRPTSELLLRSTYGQAFKAPDLLYLHNPQFRSPTLVIDPLNNNQQETVTRIFGGNPDLQPETGQSRTFGLVYASQSVRGLQLSVTHWSIDDNNNIQFIDPQVFVDNPDLFPGRVVRAPGQNGQPGVITSVDARYVNFGRIKVTGFDYGINYKIDTGFGQWLPSLAVAQTDHYTAALTPRAPPTDRLSKANIDGNFAPRWKGTAALGWKLGPFAANFDGRYLGRYLDYQDLPNNNHLGNYWLYDFSFRYSLGQALKSENRWLKDAYVGLGGTNISNRLPQYSNYVYGYYGYDQNEADIVGRTLYIDFGVKL